MMHGRRAANAQRIVAGGLDRDVTALEAERMTKGISSCVRFAAIVPATIAVWNTGPFAVAKPCDFNVANAAAGKRNTASASAERSVTAFALTSTIAGVPSTPTCERVSSPHPPM